MTSHMRFSYYGKYYMRIKENRESVICQINHSISKQRGKCFLFSAKINFKLLLINGSKNADTIHSSFYEKRLTGTYQKYSKIVATMTNTPDKKIGLNFN